MQHPRAEATIPVDADAVWELAGDFGGLAAWLPGVDSCEVEGDVRRVSMKGAQIAERLVERDDSRRAITYSIVEGMPVTHHRATLSVAPEGEAGSRVVWEADVDPDTMGPLIQAIFDNGLNGLKAIFGA